MKGLKFGVLVLVLLLVMACANPVAALEGYADTADHNDSSRGRMLQVDPVTGVVVGTFVVTNAEIIIAGVIGGTTIGIAVISSPKELLTHIGATTQAILSIFWSFYISQASHLQTTVEDHTVDFWKPGTQGYTDALHRLDYYKDKEKGIPVDGNHNPNADKNYHKMPNDGDTPYSSAYLYNSQIDKDNGCPKQIRYYGKDKKPDLDIDFYHGEEPGVTFPHKHIWENGRRGGHNYEGIKEIINNWRCKNYDFENHRWK